MSSIIFTFIIFAFMGAAIGENVGRGREREKWCRHLYKTVIEVEACQEKADWEKGSDE